MTDDAAEEIGIKAEAEALAHLKIVRVLRKLPTQEQRECVMDAVVAIIEADRRLPGVLAATARGFQRKPKGVR